MNITIIIKVTYRVSAAGNAGPGCWHIRCRRTVDHVFFLSVFKLYWYKNLNNPLKLLRFFFFFFSSNYSNTDSDCLLDYRQKCWCIPLQANWTKHLSSSFILLPWVSIKCGVFLDVTLDSFGTRRVIRQDTGRYFPLTGPLPWRLALLCSTLLGCAHVIRLLPSSTLFQCCWGEV